MNKQNKVSSKDIVIGGVYSFVNSFNYVTVLKVSRVTDKSVFTYRLLDGGIYSKDEYRQSLASFSKYTFQPNV